MKFLTLSILIKALLLNTLKLVASQATTISTTVGTTSTVKASQSYSTTVTTTTISTTVGTTSTVTASQNYSTTVTTTTLKSTVSPTVAGTNLSVVMKFTGAYTSSYANISSASSLAFIGLYNAFIYSATAGNPPSSVTVTSLFSGSIGVNSVLTYSNTNAAPTASSLASALTTYASTANASSGLGQYVAGSLSVSSGCLRDMPVIGTLFIFVLVTLFYVF